MYCYPYLKPSSSYRFRWRRHLGSFDDFKAKLGDDVSKSKMKLFGIPIAAVLSNLNIHPDKIWPVTEVCSVLLACIVVNRFAFLFYYICLNKYRSFHLYCYILQAEKSLWTARLFTPADTPAHSLTLTLSLISGARGAGHSTFGSMTSQFAKGVISYIDWWTSWYAIDSWEQRSARDDEARGRAENNHRPGALKELNELLDW